MPVLYTELLCGIYNGTNDLTRHLNFVCINTLHAKYFCRANAAVSFWALSVSTGRTTGALAVGTVPITRAVTQLLCRQEIDIETWAGPTFEASRVVTRSFYRR